MTSAVWDRTNNIKLGLLEFGFPNWADDANLNMQLIDAAMGLSGITIDGSWKNNTAYPIGVLIVDPELGSLWRCAVAHTSAVSPALFAEDRAAHPTYWLNADSVIVPRGQWTTATVYYPNDVVYKNASKYSWAMATQQFTSGASYDADVAAGKLAIITDQTQAVVDVEADRAEAEASKNTAVSSAATAVSNASSATASATAAGTSATNAATSASQALTSKNAAATSETNAAAAKTAAELAEVNAETAETNAEAALAQMLPDANADGKTYGRYNYTWRQVADTSLPEAPNDGKVYGRLNYTWVNIAGPVFMSDSPPASPIQGQLWWQSSSGMLFVYYYDGNSYQWVPSHIGTGPQGPPGPAGGIGEAPLDSKQYGRQSTGWTEIPDEVVGGRIYISATAPASPNANDVWIDIS